MKRLISLMLVLAVCVLAFASCGACEHKDADKDYKCDECGEALEKPDTPDNPDTPDTPDNPDTPDTPDAPDADLTADEWEDLFSFANVTIEFLSVEDGDDYVTTYRFTNGHVYVERSGYWSQIPDGSEEGITYMFDFADDFAKFELKDGVYQSTEGINFPTEFTGGDVVTASNIRVSVSDGKITSVVYDWTAVEDGETDSGSMTIRFTKQGTTTAPDSTQPDTDDPAIPTPNGALTEEEWRAAFDYSNVTINLTEIFSEQGPSANSSMEYRITADAIYANFGDGWTSIAPNRASSITYSIDFTDYYSCFSYQESGKYFASEIEFDLSDVLGIPNGYSQTATNIELHFGDNGKPSYVSYNYTSSYGSNVSSGSISFKINNYGTTTPPSDENGTTYIGNDITFDYDEGFVKQGEVYIKGATNFSVQSAKMSDEDVEIFANLDNTNFESTFLPKIAPSIEPLGISITDWNVSLGESNYGAEFLIIELWLENNGSVYYQAQLYVLVNGDTNTFTQIACTAPSRESAEFIGTIAESIKLITEGK